MSKDGIKTLLDKLEEVRRSIDRLEKLAGKLDEDWGNMSFIAWLEEDLKEEKIYAADGRLCLTGLGDHDIGWTFEETVAEWEHVYSENTQEAAESFEAMAQEFVRLGEMFKEAAEQKKLALA